MLDGMISDRRSHGPPYFTADLGQPPGLARRLKSLLGLREDGATVAMAGMEAARGRSRRGTCVKRSVGGRGNLLLGGVPLRDPH